MDSKFARDDQRVALIVIPTVARPQTLLPAFARLLEHLDGLPVHICVSINPVNPGDGDTSQREVTKLWQSYCAESIVPAGSLLTVYRHPGPCGFGGALNRGVLAAADGLKVRVGPIGPDDTIVSPVTGAEWPQDMIRSVSAGGLMRYGDGGEESFEGVNRDRGPGLPPLIIFYNDDLEAADGWLAELVAASQPSLDTICDICEPSPPGKPRNKRPVSLYGKIGLVGPVTNLAAGMQCLTAEAKDWRTVGTDAFAQKWRGGNAGLVLTADFLSGFCMGITRDCLEALWGALPLRDGPALFDEVNYPIAGYEDNDLCVRASEAGYRAAICAGSFVGHIGHQSFDALFPEMQRGMRNRLSYYAKWAPWVKARACRLVAALRIKIEVPHDLRLLRPTLQRLGELVDGVSILFTSDMSDVLSHPETEAEVRTGEIPQEDLQLLRSLAHPNIKGSGKRRNERIQTWVKVRLAEGATAQQRKTPAVGIGFWPDVPMNERNERNAVIQQAEAMGASWIWSIDHDEVVEPRIQRAHLDRWMSHPDPLVSSLDQGFYTTWDSLRLYRLDSPWGDGGRMTGGMRGWRLWRVNPKAPGRILAGTENGLHCGNSPTSDPMTKRHAAIRILHHGYVREQDRDRKQARYNRQDPNPDPSLVGGNDYGHLTYEERVTLARFMPRNGIGLHMLVHAGEDMGGVMSMLEQVHTMTDAVALVWTSPPDHPKREEVDEIARLFGAMVVDHPINPERGGLADARNAGIDALADCEQQLHLGMGWSLFMDPDEQLPDGAVIAIRRLADATDCWGWLFPYVNPHRKGAPSHSESIRMARLHPLMRMDGRVHEGFGEAIRGLKRAGYGDILRTAPFTCLNLGLTVADDVLQAKYDRYFTWACNAIQDGVGRSVDWITLALYFANEGLWKAPERALVRATTMDGDSFLAPRELAVHYLRMARGPAALSASRLPEGDPKHEHMRRIVELCDEEAPAIAGMALGGKAQGRTTWTETDADGLITMLELLTEGMVQPEPPAPVLVEPPAPVSKAEPAETSQTYTVEPEDDGEPE